MGSTPILGFFCILFCPPALSSQPRIPRAAALFTVYARLLCPSRTAKILAKNTPVVWNGFKFLAPVIMHGGLGLFLVLGFFCVLFCPPALSSQPRIPRAAALFTVYARLLCPSRTAKILAKNTPVVWNGFKFLAPVIMHGGLGLFLVLGFFCVLFCPPALSSCLRSFYLFLHKIPLARRWGLRLFCYNAI